MYNYFLAFAIACLPFMLILFLKPKINLRFIILTAFLMGLLVLLGVPVQISKLFLEISIGFLFIYSILSVSINEEKYRVPGLLIFTMYSVVVLLSFMINGSSYIETVLFYRHILISYLFLLAVTNINFNSKTFINTNKLIVTLFTLQIVTSIMKIFILGTSQESLIGTISYAEGALATVFPLFGIGLIISFFLFHKKKSLMLYVILIIGLLLIGFASGKRAIWIYTPLLFTSIFIIYIRVKNRISLEQLWKYSMIILFVVGLALYSGGRLIPTLNPENEVGGTFDIEYMIYYAHEYSTRTTGTGETFGRINTTKRVIEVVSQNKETMLFGFGPDAIERGENARERTSEFGVSYGLTGFSYTLLTTGFLGAILIPILYLFFCFKVMSNFKNMKRGYQKALAFGFIVSTSVFLIDFFTYSKSFLYSEVMYVTYFYLLGSLLNKSIQKL